MDRPVAPRARGARAGHPVDRRRSGIARHSTRRVRSRGSPAGHLHHRPRGGPDRAVGSQQDEAHPERDLDDGLRGPGVTVAGVEGGAVPLRVLGRHGRRRSAGWQGDLLGGGERRGVRGRLGPRPGLERSHQVHRDERQHADEEEHACREDADRAGRPEAGQREPGDGRGRGPGPQRPVEAFLLPPLCRLPFRAEALGVGRRGPGLIDCRARRCGSRRPYPGAQRRPRIGGRDPGAYRSL